MEILILIGIFAFVIAILFRSNEALDRVGEVEKEVKTIEEEIVQPGAPEEEKPQQSVQEVEPVSEIPVEPTVSTIEIPQESAVESPKESIEDIEEVQPQVENTSEVKIEEAFPRPDDVHMNH